MTQARELSSSQDAGADNSFDVLVVGAGVSGLYALHKLRGKGYRVRVVEAADDVGGTWYYNRYPGARCDIESMSYSYAFSDDLQQEWRWSERYATQAEILRYINHVADRFDLRRDIAFNTRVSSMHFDDTSGRWQIVTEDGKRLDARFCIMATGCLSTPKHPEVDGIGDFKGACYHTGQWPHEPVDFTGKRVAVIGTGASAIQSVPEIAKQAAQLTVFQRTPAFSVPAHNMPLSDEDVARWKADYPKHRARERSTHSGFHNEGGQPSARRLTDEQRHAVLQDQWDRGGLLMWNVFSDLMKSPEANACAADFLRAKIRSIVADPETAELLCPKDYPMGSKRLCVDSGYYEAFNRDTVSLVDISRSGIERITPKGVLAGGKEYEFDVIVFATGFDAMTGTLLRMDIRGRGGLPLKDKWQGGPRTYLGLMMSGFPNLFTITGPGSPSFLANVMVGLEQHIDWISDCLDHMRDNGLTTIEPQREAEDDWVEHVNELSKDTLFQKGKSWYLGANVPGKPRIFMAYIGGAHNYRDICNDIAHDGYRGFTLAGPPSHVPGREETAVAAGP